MDLLVRTAIQLAVIWAVCTGIVWVSVRLVGRRLKVIDAASIAFVGSLLSLGALLLSLGGILVVAKVIFTFAAWAVLLLLACGLSPWRAAVSSLVVQVLAFTAFHLIR
jgi:hypothetical protein